MLHACSPGADKTSGVTIHHGKQKMFSAEVSSPCVSEQQCVDHRSWTYKLIYTTAIWALKYQPHPEHPCFALLLVTDHSHTEMSPKGFLVATHCHFPMRPPPRSHQHRDPLSTKSKGATPALTNMSHHATFMKELEPPETRFSRSLGNPSTAAGWAAAFPRDSWCFRL